MIYEYTGGREGTHSITMAKPVGGGYIDIEHVPLDQIELYATNGYYALDSTGTYPYVGYCISQPTDADHHLEADCEPASVTPVLFKQTESATTVPPVPLPTHLPAVGSTNWGFVIVMVGTLVALVLLNRHKR